MNKLTPEQDYQRKINRSFQRFRLGLALFFVGFVILYAVDQLLQPSLQQEIMAGIALVIIVSGLCLALWAEIVFVCYRVFSFFFSK